MNVAFLSLGGNLGRRLENIQNAITALKTTGIKIVKESQVYETEAWGSSSDKKFLNQVIQIRTTLDAPQLLKKLLFIEKNLGRLRNDDRNSDRTIDIDILFFNDQIIDRKHLHVPHPRLPLRKFVLVPLNEIAAQLKHPILNQTIGQLLHSCTDSLLVKVYKKPWLICIEGNIGAGKSTIAAALASKYGAVFLAERYKEQSFLPLFYSNPATYAFPLEYSFFLDRWQQLFAMTEKEEVSIVCDYSIYKSFCFASVNLSKSDYKLFEKKGMELIGHLPKPDLIIYLDSNRRNLKQNILHRGRVYEKAITDDYLRLLGYEYKNTLERLYGKQVKTVRISHYDRETTNAVLKKTETLIGKIV